MEKLDHVKRKWTRRATPIFFSICFSVVFQRATYGQFAYDTPFSQHGIIPTWETTGQLYPVGKGQFSLRHVTLGIADGLQISAESFRIALRVPNIKIKARLSKSRFFCSSLALGFNLVLSGAADSFFRTTNEVGRINNFSYSFFSVPLTLAVTITPNSYIRLHGSITAMATTSNSVLKNRLDVGQAFWAEILLSKQVVAGLHLLTHSLPSPIRLNNFKNRTVIQYGPSLRFVFRKLFARVAYISQDFNAKPSWAFLYDLGLAF